MNPETKEALIDLTYSIENFMNANERSDSDTREMMTEQFKDSVLVLRKVLQKE